MRTTFTKPQKQNVGFTLIELLVVVVIMGIAMAIAMPSISTFMSSSRVTSLGNDLVSDIAYARSEAVKRHGSVVLCRSSTPGLSSPSCDSAGLGWIVYYVDSVNGNVVLKAHENVPSDFVLTFTGGTTVGFNALGYQISGSANTVSVCAPNVSQRDITIAVLGEINLNKVAASC